MIMHNSNFNAYILATEKSRIKEDDSIKNNKLRSSLKRLKFSQKYIICVLEKKNFSHNL